MGQGGAVLVVQRTSSDLRLNPPPPMERSSTCSLHTGRRSGTSTRRSGFSPLPSRGPRGHHRPAPHAAGLLVRVSLLRKAAPRTTRASERGPPTTGAADELETTLGSRGPQGARVLIVMGVTSLSNRSRSTTVVFTGASTGAAVTGEDAGCVSNERQALSVTAPRARGARSVDEAPCRPGIHSLQQSPDPTCSS